MKVTPFNGNIFVLPIRETKQTGGLDLISRLDEEDRYVTGEVIYACELTPLTSGDIVLYDKSNGHGYQDDDSLLTVLHISNITGKL